MPLKRKGPAPAPKAKPPEPISPEVQRTGTSSSLAAQATATESLHCLNAAEVSVNGATYRVPQGKVTVPTVVAAVLRDTGKAI
jgi:hypothetical protein